MRERIRALRRIELQNADIDFLKRRLEPILRGYLLVTPILMPGQRVFRGVLWPERPTYINQLKQPPPHKVTTIQRANRPGEPRFYCSAGAPAAVFELRPKKGDRIAISEWHVLEKLCMLNVGYDERALVRMGSRRDSPHWQRAPIEGERRANKLLHEFLASEFTRDVPTGSEHLYKLTVAIAEKLSGQIVALERAVDMPRGSRFAGRCAHRYPC